MGWSWARPRGRCSGSALGGRLRGLAEGHQAAHCQPGRLPVRRLPWRQGDTPDQGAPAAFRCAWDQSLGVPPCFGPTPRLLAVPCAGYDALLVPLTLNPDSWPDEVAAAARSTEHAAIGSRCKLAFGSAGRSVYSSNLSAREVQSSHTTPLLRACAAGASWPCAGFSLRGSGLGCPGFALPNPREDHRACDNEEERRRVKHLLDQDNYLNGPGGKGGAKRGRRGVSPRRKGGEHFAFQS